MTYLPVLVFCSGLASWMGKPLCPRCAQIRAQFTRMPTLLSNLFLITNKKTGFAYFCQANFETSGLTVQEIGATNAKFSKQEGPITI